MSIPENKAADPGNDEQPNPNINERIRSREPEGLVHHVRTGRPLRFSRFADRRNGRGEVRSYVFL